MIRITKTTKKYGLYHKKSKLLLSYRVESNNGADFSIDNAYILTNDGESPWLVDSAYNAEYVRLYSTPWYNADHSTPINDFEAEDLVTVEVEITENVEEVDVEIPTMEQLLEIKYKEKEPAHYEYAMKQLKNVPKVSYSYYDLIDLIHKKLWPKKEGENQDD